MKKSSIIWLTFIAAIGIVVYIGLSHPTIKATPTTPADVIGNVTVTSMDSAGNIMNKTAHGLNDVADSINKMTGN